jgi:hypothetical protein
VRRPLGIVFLLALVAFAGDETKLPWNPWEKAATGDWERLESEVKAPKKDEGKARVPERVTYEIRGVDEKEVKLGLAKVPASDDDRLAVVYARAETPSFEKLFSLASKVENAKTSEEKKKIGDREVACTRVAFTTKAAVTNHEVSITLWFSKDVKGIGLVEELVEGGGATVTYKLSGYGSKDKVDWGTRPAKK